MPDQINYVSVEPNTPARSKYQRTCCAAKTDFAFIELAGD